jgi:hypothetical protein
MRELNHRYVNMMHRVAKDERPPIRRYWIHRADRRLRMFQSMDKFPRSKELGLLVWSYGRLKVSSQRLRQAIGEARYQKFLPRMRHVGANGISPEVVEEFLWEDVKNDVPNS